MAVFLNSLFVKLCLVFIFIHNDGIFVVSTKNIRSETTTEVTARTLGYTSTTTEITTTLAPLTCNETHIDNITILSVGETQVNVSINITLDNEEFCNKSNISIICIANSDMNWPGWVNETRYQLVANYSVTYFELGGLSEYTNYTCKFEILDGSNSMDITFTTREVPPSEPRKLNVTQITSSGFTFTWIEPIKIPTILLGYDIDVRRGNMSSENHYWSHCGNEPNETQSYFINSTLLPNVLHFEKGLADFNYTVTIKAWSKAGSGISADVTVQTLIAVSEPPNNVSNEVRTEIMDRDKERALNLSWNMPCNTNGPVDYFMIEIHSYYLIDESIVEVAMFNVTIDSNSKYYFNIPNLMAASNHSVQICTVTVQNSNTTIQGKTYNFTFLTDDNYPNAPKTIVNMTKAHSFIIYWDEPTNRPGRIKEYVVLVNLQKVNWNQTDDCVIDESTKPPYHTETQEYPVTGVIPYSTYNVAVSAETNAGVGNSTNITVTSKMYEPELQNVTWSINQQSISGDAYKVNGSIHFTPGCFYGPFISYDISFIGNRSGNTEDSGGTSILNPATMGYSFSLRPDHIYFVNVTLRNSELGTTKSVTFTSPVGVPVINDSVMSNIQPIITQTEATLTLNRTYFDDENGDLSFIAIIVSDANVTGGEFSTWDNSKWPKPSGDAKIYYQATPKFWNPFHDSNSFNYTLGNEKCSEEEEMCNRPLEPAKTYFVFIRLFNTQYYRNTMPIVFTTDPTSKVAIILGIIFGLLAASAIGFVGFILWRKGIINVTNIGIVAVHARRKRSENDTSTCNCDRELLTKFLTKEDSGPTTEFSKERFIEYCDYLEHNPDELNKQWQELDMKSEEIYKNYQNNFALLPENRRKNRFTNILPFDESRVKLNIDEDDEICSDYINASYIKGYSNRHEYIATQGPLPETVRDFWKMVFQENVSVIIMLARFIENKREKCYKYFPNNHETMSFGDDIEVRCSAELDFQIYCVRTLQVRKDSRQVTISHMQFLEWPDFGVPDGTEDLLSFCQQLRDRWALEGGLAVVHCSAGVGRTGTIIATDLLIRAIEADKKIDVFNTVLELRRQRKNMVQTEKQYLYIYQLIKGILETPLIYDEENSDHLYENVELATGNRSGVVESAL